MNLFKIYPIIVNQPYILSLLCRSPPQGLQFILKDSRLCILKHQHYQFNNIVVCFLSKVKYFFFQKTLRFLLPVTFPPLLIYIVLFNFLLKKQHINKNMQEAKNSWGRKSEPRPRRRNQILPAGLKNNFNYKKKVLHEEQNTNLKPES